MIRNTERVSIKHDFKSYNNRSNLVFDIINTVRMSNKTHSIKNKGQGLHVNSDMVGGLFSWTGIAFVIIKWEDLLRENFSLIGEQGDYNSESVKKFTYLSTQINNLINICIEQWILQNKKIHRPEPTQTLQDDQEKYGWKS